MITLASSVTLMLLWLHHANAADIDGLGNDTAIHYLIYDQQYLFLHQIIVSHFVYRQWLPSSKANEKMDGHGMIEIP